MTTTSHSIAVIGGDGIGPEVVAEALKVVACRRRRRSTPIEFDLGGARYLRTGEVLTDDDARRAARLRRHPPRRRRHARRAARGARARPAPEAALRPRPVRQPAALPRCRRTSTSSSSARTPRAPTPARAASCARARRTRSPRRARSTPAWASSGASASPSTWPAAAPRKHLTLVHKTNVLTFAGDLWQRTFDEVPAEYPDVDHRLQPRRRGVHLLRAGPAALRRDRHRQPVRRHPHRPRRRGVGRHRLRRVGATSTRPAPVRRCSSRCTARRPTSPGTSKANPIAAILSRGDDARVPGRGRRRRPHPQGLCRPVTLRVDNRDRRRSSQKGSEMPITPTEKIWMNGELVDWADAKIHILTHSLHYGMGVFEGIRAYETDRRSRGLPPHRPHQPPARLGPDPDDASAVLGRRAGRGDQGGRAGDGLPSCYIRPIAYYGYGEMGLNTLPCRSTWPSPAGRGAPTSATTRSPRACA